VTNATYDPSLTKILAEALFFQFSRFRRASSLPAEERILESKIAEEVRKGHRRGSNDGDRELMGMGHGKSGAKAPNFSPFSRMAARPKRFRRYSPVRQELKLLKVRKQHQEKVIGFKHANDPSGLLAAPTTGVASTHDPKSKAGSRTARLSTKNSAGDKAASAQQPGSRTAR